MQKDTVNRKVPARVNPLLIKENLDQRMQSAMEASGLGNHVDAAMDKLRVAVRHFTLLLRTQTQKFGCTHGH